MPGQRRLHMHNERDPRRRLILDRVAALPIRVLDIRPGQRETRAPAVRRQPGLTS